MASGGGAEKGRRTCNHIWNLNICIEKVDAKCWLAEMTLVMTSLPLALVFQCLYLRSFPLGADWQKSDSSVDGEPQGNWRRNSNSRDVVASFPSFCCPAARVHLWELAHRLAPFKYLEANSIYYNDLKCSFKNTVHAKRISISTAKVCFEELFLFKL